MSTPEAISQRDAAKRLGVSTATIERWVRRGQLNTIRTGKNNGARRILTDEAFHAAATRPNKIHHIDSGAPEKSVTLQNPSHPEDDTGRTVDTTPEARKNRDDGFVARLDPARQADSADPLAESLTSTAAESVIAMVQESITTEDAQAGTDKLPVTGGARGSGAQTPSPPGPQSPSPARAPAGSERRRSSTRRPSDADLVPLTGPPSPPRPSPAARSQPRGRGKTLALLALATAVLIVASGVILHEERGPAPGRHISPAVQRQPQAERPPVRRSRVLASAARGGHAASLAVNTPRPSRNAAPIVRSVEQKPARVASTVAPAAKPPGKPITPCQSSGICVR